jgi:hypothetical protein
VEPYQTVLRPPRSKRPDIPRSLIDMTKPRLHHIP